MDFVHSISEIAQHLQSAVGNYWNGEWENHAGRLPKFDQHGMGSSVAHGAHLSRAGIGATVFSGGYARPSDPRSVRSWGTFNAVEIQHPILGKIPIIQRWAGPGVQEQSGSGYTVKAVTRHHGPSERFTANLADLDLSTLNIVTGQSGNFMSPHYMDQWKAWYEGSTFTLPFSAKAVEAAKAHRLVLEPGQ